METQGFELNYRVQTEFGDVSINWLNTYVSKLEQKTEDVDETPPQAQDGFGGNFRVRSTLNIGWERGALGVSWGIRYYSSSKEKCSLAVAESCNLADFLSAPTGGTTDPQNRTGSNAFHDLQLRYAAPWNAPIALGANNVFDQYAAPSYSRAS